MGENNICKKCSKLKYVADLGMLICICIIVDLSSKDPFDSHIIGNINN